MDKVAHGLEQGHIKIESDPELEIYEGNFEHGGVRLVIYYHDEKGNVVPKSQSTESRIYELDNSGKVVWSTVKKI